MIDEKLIKEALDASEKFYSKLPFEFHWDFAGFNDDKELVKSTVINAYFHGYIDGKEKKV